LSSGARIFGWAQL